MGSPLYMAPEQMLSTRDVDARADIWALGVILYQALSGRLPFPANSITEFAVKSVMDPPDPIDVDPSLRAVIMKALEKDAAQRFADIGAFAQALAPFGGTQARAQAQLARSLLAPTVGHADTIAAGHAPVPTTLQIAARATTPTAQDAKPARKGFLLGIGLVAAAVAGGAAVVVVMSRREPPPPAPVKPAEPVAAAVVPVDAAVVAPPPPVALVDAAELAAAAPVDAAPAPAPAPKHPVTKRPAVAAKEPAVAPFVPQAQPQPPPPQANAASPEKVAEFEHAIATRHCQHALTMLPQLGYSTPEYQKYTQEASACATERGKAMQDFQSPATERVDPRVRG